MIIKRLTTGILLLAFATIVTGCGVDPRTAKRALEANGLTNIRIEGYSWFGCGKEDAFASNFSAVGVNGQPVTGSVCQGIFKGTTIRFD